MIRSNSLPLAILVLALAVPGGSSSAGTRVKPPKGKGKGRPTFKIPKHWVKCKKCGIYLPPRMSCPNCPPKGFEKCPKCGAFHPENHKCGYCAQKKIPRREARCPVCRKAFNGPISFNRNDKGGTDRDFCRHSLGRNVVEALVWSCPRCGHTHWCPELRDGTEYPGKFNEKVTPAYARTVVAKVKPVMIGRLAEEVGRVSAKLRDMISEIDQLDVPDWIKYEAGLLCAEARGDDAAVLAKLALEGSYACRREMVKAVDIPALSRTIPVLERMIAKHGGVSDDPRTVIKVIVDLLRRSKQIELKKKRGRPLNAAEKYYLYLRLAGCWDRMGNTDMASEALDQAGNSVKRVPAPPKVLKPFAAIVEYRKKILARESVFRARAAREMRKALVEDNAYHSASVMPTVYLLGELYRREEQYSRARPWLALSAKMARTVSKNHLLVKLVKEIMALPSMRDAVVDEKEEAAVLALVVRLTGRDPGELISKKKPEPEDGAPRTVTGRPIDCAGCLANLYKAYVAWVDKHKKPPPDLEALIKAKLITREAAGGLKCPGCGARFRYRQPRSARGGNELLIWCKKLILYADGKTKAR